MTIQFRCDWCGEVFEDRKSVVCLDATFEDAAGGVNNPSLHACPSCVPDWVRDLLPASVGGDPDE